jgi:hypothetical protein
VRGPQGASQGRVGNPLIGGARLPNVRCVFTTSLDLSRPLVNQADRRAEPLVPGCAMIKGAWVRISNGFGSTRA